MIRILLVDDDDINNFLLKHLLKKSGFDVQGEVFTNPIEAIAYIKKCNADANVIDLLLLDINMPLLSGWEVLDELRLTGETLISGNRIYMLSSSVHSTDIEQAEKYKEVMGFISKPIGLSQLTEIFAGIAASKLE